MDKIAVKEIMFGSIQEMARNKKFYYKGIGPDYSHWTEEGREALRDFLDVMTYELLVAEEQDLKQRAKDLVINGLKGEKT